MLSEFITYCKRVWRSNDPLEILQGVVSDGGIVVGDEEIDITHLITWVCGNSKRSGMERTASCNIIAQPHVFTTENPVAIPPVSMHNTSITISKFEIAETTFEDGDIVLVLKTQKPVTYILLGKLWSATTQ
jgi:hypothetical protein